MLMPAKVMAVCQMAMHVSKCSSSPMWARWKQGRSGLSAIHLCRDTVQALSVLVLQ